MSSKKKQKRAYQLARLKNVVFSILILFPAFAKGQKVLTEKKQLTFSDLVANIKKIDLPIYHKCGEDFKVHKNINPKLYKYFPPLYPDIPEYGWHIAGKLLETPQYVALLSLNTYADYAIPYLITFTREGKLITKLELYSDGCSDEELYYSEAAFTINKELFISLKDSSSSYKRDNAGEVIKKSVKSTFHKYHYKFNTDGRILKVSTQKSN